MQSQVRWTATARGTGAERRSVSGVVSSLPSLPPQEVSTVFPYPGGGWIKPASPEVGAMILMTCKIASICQLIGFATHIATFVGYLSFTWLFHICESNFNNHYIFMCHILFLGTFMHWGHWLSVDHVICRFMG